LIVCPRCGIKINKQIKTLSIIGRHNRNSEQSKVWLGFFICPECQKRFLQILEKENAITIKNAVKEIKGIKMGLQQRLNDFKEKIDNLKNERTELLGEIKQLKIEGKKKANTLEEQIGQLRKEVKDLRELLGKSK
jgi:uncharacterized coiled-coil DUF342 family protein